MVVPFNLFHLIVISLLLIWSLIRFGASWDGLSGWPVLDHLITTVVCLILLVSWFILGHQ